MLRIFRKLILGYGKSNIQFKKPLTYDRYNAMHLGLGLTIKLDLTVIPHPPNPLLPICHVTMQVF